MKVIFGSRKKIGSLLLRFFTFSRWSHVGIVYGDSVVEASILRVRTIPLCEFKLEYPEWEMGDLPCADEAKARDYAYSRVGNLYDFGGLLAFPFRLRNWQASSRDFCSELPVCAAQVGGTEYVRDVHRVTPELLYQLTRTPS